MAADAQSWVVEPDGPVTQAQLIKPQAQQANFGGQGQQLGPGGPQRPPGEPGAINRYRFYGSAENDFRSKQAQLQAQRANFGGQGGQQLGPGGPQRPPGEPGAINRYRLLMVKEGTSRDGNYFRSRRESAQCCVWYKT